MKIIFGNIILWTIVTVFILNPSAEGCSCAPAHPQTHFCNADFVVVVRPLRRSHRLNPGNVAYKVEVKKSFKMDKEAHKIFKDGRILTAAFDSLCGVSLKLGRLYMIAGRVPQLNACSYIKEYMKMSIVERRGFSGAYRKGCKCRVQPCFRNRCSSFDSTTTCSWSPVEKCQTDHSACLPTLYATPEGRISKCDWQKTVAYKQCISSP